MLHRRGFVCGKHSVLDTVSIQSSDEVVSLSYSCDRYLSEIGELQMLGSEDDEVMIPLKSLYEKIAEEKSGCCWESYEVYRYLKGLGYIIRRHGVPWTSMDAAITTPSGEEELVCVGECPEDKYALTRLLGDMRICDARAVFDVYLPNSRFKKSSPGEPSFVACFSG